MIYKNLFVEKAAGFLPSPNVILCFTSNSAIRNDNKKILPIGRIFYGGEKGIRTLETG